VKDVIFLALELGLVALVLVLLNARDRRRDRTAAVVLEMCPMQFRRGGLALRVRAPLCSRRTVAVLDMSECGADEAWSLMSQLAYVLPPDIVLVIDTRLDGPRSIAVTLTRPRGTQRARHQPRVIACG
jgi:hypothetical protein